MDKETLSHPWLTFHILHDHAEVSPCLKRAEHAHNKRVLRKRQDVSLHKHLLDLVPQDQVLPVDLLHCKTLPCLTMPHQVHGPVCQTLELGSKLSGSISQPVTSWLSVSFASGHRIYINHQGNQTPPKSSCSEHPTTCQLLKYCFLHIYKTNYAQLYG